MRWFDYLCKRDERGVTNARLVKQEFWSVFRVARGHVRKANRNLENYLEKKVSDMMYRARIDAIKDHEGCNDAKATNILRTEEEFISCRQDWCPMDAWALLAKHWASKDCQDKMLVAQNARAKGAKDSAQNRGGSRPWAETQQFLEYKFSAERAGTLNTYAVMKSGFKNVDSTGRSAPVRSRKAKERLITYSSGVGSCQDDMHDNQDEMCTDSDDGDYDMEDEESYHDSSGDDTDENSCEGSKVNSDYSGSEDLEDN